MSSKPMVGQATAQWMRNNMDICRLLPDADESFTHDDIDGIGQPEICKLHYEGIIERVGRETLDKSIWQLNPLHWEYIQQRLQNRSLTPCNHCGVRTITAGETYTCTRDDCDETFGRDVAAEVLG